MSKKDDFIAALQRREPPGRTPLWELEFHIWDAATGRRLVLGEEFAHLPGWEQARALHANAEIFVAAAEALHFAAITLPAMFWEIAPGYPAYYWLPEDARYHQAAAIRALQPDLLLVGNCSAALGIPMGADYVPFAYQLFDAPDEVDALAAQRLEEGLGMARRFAEVGVEIGLSTTDLADNHGTFMRPAQLERFVWPYFRCWVAELKRLGMYSILHSDGNLLQVLETIAGSGVDALQAIDPTAGMDLLETKRQVGNRLCLCGNIDCALFLTGTPQKVYQATADLLEAAVPGGGFILGASNAVQVETPLENYLAMIRAWEEKPSGFRKL